MTNVPPSNTPSRVKPEIFSEETYRSQARKLNEDHDMVRVELRMTLNDWRRIKKLL